MLGCRGLFVPLLKNRIETRSYVAGVPVRELYMSLIHQSSITNWTTWSSPLPSMEYCLRQPCSTNTRYLHTSRVWRRNIDEMREKVKAFSRKTDHVPDGARAPLHGMKLFDNLEHEPGWMLCHHAIHPSLSPPGICRRRRTCVRRGSGKPLRLRARSL